MAHAPVDISRGGSDDMMELVWDEELAVGAQLWANQCNFNHDKNDVCR